MEGSEQIKPKTQQEALLEISALIEQAVQVGVTDSEPSRLKEIRDALYAGIIGPEEAVSRALEIKETRQDH